MSLYIPGLNLPPKGEKRLALFIGSDGVVDVYRSVGEATPYLESYVLETEAIEVPPHGRLIDADALDTKFLQDGFSKAITRRKSMLTYGDARQYVHSAPTIIPEDKDGDAK